MEEENKAGLSGWRLKLNVVLHTRVIHRANFSASNMGDFCQEQEHQLEDIMLPRTKTTKEKKNERFFTFLT